MNIKVEEFIEKNMEAILPHLLEVNADNQVRIRHTPLYSAFACHLNTQTLVLKCIPVKKPSLTEV